MSIIDDKRFDVFVSCKGGSAIETHADPLVLALKKAQLHTFYYKDYGRPGGIIDEKIRTALKKSRSAIILFSKNYADSYWCLEELRLILKRDKSSVFPFAIIYCEGVSYRDLQYEDNSKYYPALERHRRNASPEKIRKWKKALKNAGWREGEAAPQDKQKLSKFFEKIANYIKGQIIEGSKAPLQPERKRIGPSGVPDPPDFTAGLDGPLNIVKGMLLTDSADHPVMMPYSADEISMQMLVLISAPPGCGKTTLAKKLCRDPEIEDRFKSNIFFVPVSQKVDITVIVQRIYKHYRASDVPPAIVSDEDALSQLENLVKTLAEDQGGVLLVLDDVWCPETLVKKFMFRVAAGRYKLLVTSIFKCASFESSTYDLKPLFPEDAEILFRRSAGCTETGDWQDDHVDELVKICNGFPLVLTVVGQILCRAPEVTWLTTKRQANIVKSDKIMLATLKKSVDALDEKMTKCFLDLGLFPEDQRIPTNALIDIWEVLYGFDEGVDTHGMLYQLANRNLVNFVTKREGASYDGNNLGHFVTLHDVLRMLAIHMSSEEEQRTRLFMEMNRNGFCNVQTHEHITNARLLSITTTGNPCSSSWSEMQQDSVEVLIVNLSTGNYFLPELVKLIKLKALAITNYGSALAQISDFARMIGNLSSLERIRLENVSVPSLGSYTVQLMKVKKISLNLCKIDKALGSWIDKFPNLEEIEIYCCPDLDQLPAVICNLLGLKKLTVVSCNELCNLPQELGKLVHLQHLRLNSCTKLGALPESIGGLKNLRVLDISDCVNITYLPEGVGELNGSLRKLDMLGCWGLVDLPSSLSALNNTTVRVDESKHFLWQDYKNVKVRVVRQVSSLDWLYNLRK